jgi:hypothetical protein
MQVLVFADADACMHADTAAGNADADACMHADTAAGNIVISCYVRQL